MKPASRLLDEQGRYRRPALVRSRPDRHFAGFYRSAEEDGHGGQVPRSAEQAVVQAVRMAYQVAEEQIARSARLAARLKRAGDAEVGPGSDLQALDAIERLVLKAGMAALGWAETAAAEPGSPLRRAAAAQYRGLGALLGLMDAPAAAPTPAPAPAPASPTAAAPLAQRRPASAATPPRLHIVYSGKERRAVLDVRDTLPSLTGPAQHEAHFYSARLRNEPPLLAMLQVGATDRRLHLPTRADAPAGWWAAAICADDGTLLGTIEIRL